MKLLTLGIVILVLVAGLSKSSLSAIVPADMVTCKPLGPDLSRESTISANDNRFPAGRFSGRTLRLSLVAKLGVWYPDPGDHQAIPMQAFAECGQLPQIPGPLIRVSTHTKVLLLVRNTFPHPLLMHGLVDRPSKVDQGIVVPSNSERLIRFQLDAPGTYLYWGTTTGSTMENRLREDSQLSGAIVVDPESGPAAKDRVFVISRWVNVNKADGTPDNTYELNLINGRTWPYTERPTYVKNSLVRWRWANASAAYHPLHLHGFYFHVDSRGDGISEARYSRSARDMEVTELLPPGATYSMTWKAARPGNWLFHCHLIYHVIGHVPISAMLEGRSAIDPARYDNELVRKLGMGGLTLGVTVTGKAPTVSAKVGRRVSVLVEPAPNDLPNAPSYRYVLKGSGVPEGLRTENAPPIVLTRGVPVAIDVTNHLSAPTQVHWHGMELADSYYDGVAGFSGSGKRLTPMIMQGQTFEARFTPARAGTFIYHTHMDDVWQLRAGLAGPLIVLEPGMRLDPARDHIMFLGTPHAFAGRFDVVVNSATVPADLTFRVGVKQRLRFINLTTTRRSLSVSLSQNGRPALWEPLARDGAQIPKERQLPETAIQTISIGQTRDFTFTPRERTTMQLQIMAGPPLYHVFTVPVHVI